MIASKRITAIVAVLVALCLVLCLGGMLYSEKLTEIFGGKSVKMEYENKLFDTSQIITIDILMDEAEWNSMLDNAINEEYHRCNVKVNGTVFYGVGIRPKGNTSLSAIAMDPKNNRYSFKLEFDQYVKGQTCFGLDKLVLNNNYADATNMKEAVIYDMFGYLGADASLYNYAEISVNGNYWGIYLALEAVEDSFTLRNYGVQSGELYKPDSMNMGNKPINKGNRPTRQDENVTGNSDRGDADFPQGFPPDDFDPSQFGGNMPGGVSPLQFGDNMPEGFSPPQFGGNMPEGFDPSQFGENMPEGFDPSQFGGNMPEGFDPSQFGGNMPEGFDPSQFGGNMPEEFSPSEPEGETQTDVSEEETPTDVPESDESKKDRVGNRSFSMGGSGANLEYTDDELDSYSTIWNCSVTKTTTADHKRVVTALKNISEGNDLDKYLDVDNVLKYMAVHSFAVNEDSLSGNMAHNYYLYEKNGQLNILPWDYNLSFGGMGMKSGDASAVINDPIDTPFSGTTFFDSLLNNEEYLNRYHKYYRQLCEKYIDGGGFDSLYSRLRSQIDRLVETDPNSMYTYDEYEKAVDMLYKTVKLRSKSILGQLDGVIPSTASEQRADSSALIDASEIDIKSMGTFSMGAGNNTPGKKSQDTNSNQNSDTTAKPPDGLTSASPKLNEDKSQNFQGNKTDMAQSRRQFGEFKPSVQNQGYGGLKGNLVWLIISIVVLATGLVFAILYRQKPKQR